MIYLCPFCGRDLDRKLIDGITTCSNCNRLFDSSSYHKILSAAWAIRRWHTTLDKIVEKYILTDLEAAVLNHYVINLGYAHDQFLKVILKEGVSVAA